MKKVRAKKVVERPIDADFPISSFCCEAGSTIIRKELPEGGFDDKPWVIRCLDGEWRIIHACPFCFRAH